MSKTHKISFLIIIFSIIIAIIFGIITRSSYKYLDLDNAVFFANSDYSEEALSNLDSQKVLNQLSKANSVFVVKVKNSENIHQCTKATVSVEKVIKGDNEVLNSDVVIYEPNFIYYDKNSKEGNYFSVNTLNNQMQPNKQYLVFANKKVYSDSYQNTLDHFEYLVNIDWSLYSFPINNEIDYIQSNQITNYGNVKTYDYFCYTQKQRNILEEIRNNVLEKYI